MFTFFETFVLIYINENNTVSRKPFPSLISSYIRTRVLQRMKILNGILSEQKEKLSCHNTSPIRRNESSRNKPN